MSIIKAKAIEALRDYFIAVFGADLPDIFAHEQDPDRLACPVTLVIHAIGTFTFQPFDADELQTSEADSVQVHVGDFSGKVQLTLGSRSVPERTALGGRILNEFLKTPGKPGVLVVQLTGFDVGGVTFANNLPVGFVLGDDAWEEEMVFERKRYENIEVDVDFPALVTWEDTYDINQLVAAFTEDLTSDADDPDLETEQIQVTDTGDLEAYP